MPARTKSLVPTQEQLDALPVSVGTIFTDTQHSLANHRKNCVALRKLHESAARTDDPESGKLIGERAFRDAFIGCVDRTLPLKKGTQNVEKVVKFVGGYLAFAVDKDREAAQARAEKGEAQEDDDDETSATRLATSLLKHLLKGFGAKDRNVRFRCVQIVGLIVTSLGSIDDDLFNTLKHSLMLRLRDKEVSVRVQAVLGLSKLQGADEGDEDADEEEDEDLPGGGGRVSSVLLHILQHDPSAEVRRAALYNLFPSPAGLPILLTRARDTEPSIRRAVFDGSALAQTLAGVGNTRLGQREDLIRNGLGDRDETVRRAASKLVAAWVEEAEGDLVKFLEYFDVIESKVAEDALLSIFSNRPDIFAAVVFDDGFWSALNPESAFLVRIFVDHCISTSDDARLESSLPVVTALAFRLQNEYNRLLDVVTASSEQADDEEVLVQLANRQFVLAELLKLALNLDYGDEIGRRKMFTLVREMVTHPELPERFIPLALDILLKLSSSERDFLLLGVELSSEIRDLRIDEELEDEPAPDDAASTVFDARPAVPRRELTPEEIAHNESVDLRCLAVVIALFERVNGSLSEHTMLGGLLPQLVVPSVRNKAPAIRERGLHALGLVSLLAKDLALGSFTMFMNQAETAPDPFGIQALRIIFDLLMAHDIASFSQGAGNEVIKSFLLRTLDGHSPEFQAIACEGLAKLMLAGMVAEEELIRGLVFVYFSPEVADNQPLKQCLAYFFPVFCYSNPDNQRRMQSIFLTALSDHWDRDADELEVFPVTQVASMLAEWTDPRHGVEREGFPADEDVQLDLAIEVLKELFTEDRKDQRKTLVQILGKLYIPPEPAPSKIQKLATLISKLQELHPLADAASRNALTRFDASLRKRHADVFASDEPAPVPEELEQFLSNISAAHEDEDATPKRAARPKPKPKSRAPAGAGAAKKGRKAAKAASESEEEEEEPELDDDDEVDEDDGVEESGEEDGEEQAEAQEDSDKEVDDLLEEDDETEIADSLLGSDGE